MNVTPKQPTGLLSLALFVGASLVSFAAAGYAAAAWAFDRFIDPRP